MTPVSEQDYHFTVQTADGDEFKHYLQGILNEHHETACPLMEVPKSKKFLVRVTDEKGSVVGGALVWAHWGWLDLSLLALEKEVRGRGLGRQLMAVIEEKAREEGCTKIRVETFGNELGFYQRIWRQLDDQIQNHRKTGFRRDWQKNVDIRARQ